MGLCLQKTLVLEISSFDVIYQPEMTIDIDLVTTNMAYGLGTIDKVCDFLTNTRLMIAW